MAGACVNAVNAANTQIAQGRTHSGPGCKAKCMLSHEVQCLHRQPVTPNHPLSGFEVLSGAQHCSKLLPMQLLAHTHCCCIGLQVLQALPLEACWPSDTHMHLRHPCGLEAVGPSDSCWDPCPGCWLLWCPACAASPSQIISWRQAGTPR